MSLKIQLVFCIDFLNLRTNDYSEYQQVQNVRFSRVEARVALYRIPGYVLTYQCFGEKRINSK